MSAAPPFHSGANQKCSPTNPHPIHPGNIQGLAFSNVHQRSPQNPPQPFPPAIRPLRLCASARGHCPTPAIRISRLRVLLLLLPLLFLLTLLPAQADLPAALESTRADIAKTTAALTQLRSEIARERVGSATSLAELESKTRAKRAEWDAVRRSASTALQTEADIRRQLTAVRAETDEITALLRDYRRGLGTRVSEAEAATLDLTATDALPVAERAARLLQLGQTQLDARLGGQSLSGRAADPDGNVLDGTFTQLGPIASFQSNSGPAGPVRAEPNSPVPSFTPTDAADGQLPLDLTGGKAIDAATSRGSIWDHLRAGGLIIFPLLFMGVLGLVVAGVKAGHLFGVRPGSKRGLDKILGALQSGNSDEAHRLATRQGTPWRPVLLDGLDTLKSNASRDPDFTGEVMQERLVGQIPRLERGLWILAVIAAAAPLLGLLGTVTGMMRTFGLIQQFGTGDARLLSGGISEALVVAIPILILHAWLTRRVRRLVNTMDENIHHFVQGLRAQPKPSPPPATTGGTAP